MLEKLKALELRYEDLQNQLGDPKVYSDSERLRQVNRELKELYLCGGGAFNIFLIRQFVRSIPRELDEAATIDGAGYFRILLNVIVPSIKSAMIVVAMFLFIQIWNDLLQQMIYINTDDKFTISMGLSQLKGSLKTDWSAIMCGTCMSFVPGVVFYLLGQRYFVEGIVMTGMKN
mgnify:CR=1 FL=1